MSLVITEREMLDRFKDGLMRAQSKAIEMIKRPKNEQPAIFIEFINGIKVAAGSAHQLCHTQVDHSTQWLTVRDILEKVIDLGQALPTLDESNNGLWLKVKQTLDNVMMSGQKLFESRGMAREDILFDLDRRAKNAPNLVKKPQFTNLGLSNDPN